MEHSYLIPLTNSDTFVRATAVHIPQSDIVVKTHKAQACVNVAHLKFLQHTR